MENEIKSIWDGWSGDSQIHGHAIRYEWRWKWLIFPYQHIRYCAFQYAKEHASDEAANETFNRIAPRLSELFPEDERLRYFADGAVRYGHGGLNAVIHANDKLRVPAEVFISLDRETQIEATVKPLLESVSVLLPEESQEEV